MATKAPTTLKRYNLALPPELFERLQAVAREQNTTVVEVLRRFIKLGLIATEIEKRPDAKLIIREGEAETQILLI
jgi:hypothetical protein